MPQTASCKASHGCLGLCTAKTCTEGNVTLLGDALSWRGRQLLLLHSLYSWANPAPCTPGQAGAAAAGGACWPCSNPSNWSPPENASSLWSIRPRGASSVHSYRGLNLVWQIAQLCYFHRHKPQISWGVTLLPSLQGAKGLLWSHHGVVGVQESVRAAGDK